MAKKQTKASDIVKPIISGDSKPHALSELIDGGEAPILTSIGYKQLSGSNSWVSYVMQTRGREVISIEVDEPNVRAIAEDSAKINFVNKFMDQGL